MFLFVPGWETVVLKLLVFCVFFFGGGGEGRGKGNLLEK